MSSPAYDYQVGSHSQPRTGAGNGGGGGPLAEQEVLGTRGCVFVLQNGRWKERAIGNLKLVLDLRTLDIQIVANSVEDKIVTYLLTSRVRSKGPRAWVLKARATTTSQEEILAIRFGHETDSQAFKDFMEHAYLLDRQMTTLRQQSHQHQQRGESATLHQHLKAAPQQREILNSSNRHSAHPRLDRKTSTASFKLATQQQFPSGDGRNALHVPSPLKSMEKVERWNTGGGIGSDMLRDRVKKDQGKPVPVLPLTESNMKTHNRICPPKRRTVQNWLDQCMALQEGRSPNNMKTVNDPSHMDYIASRLQGVSPADGT